MRIQLPLDASAAQERKPREAVVRADAFVEEAILAFAQRAEDHARARIGINDGVRPRWRHDDLVAGAGLDRDASPWGVVCEFLRVNDGAAFPNLKQLGRRPSAMRRGRVDVSLAAHRL